MAERDLNQPLGPYWQLTAPPPYRGGVGAGVGYLLGSLLSGIARGRAIQAYEAEQERARTYQTLGHIGNLLANPDLLPEVRDRLQAQLTELMVRMGTEEARRSGDKGLRGLFSTLLRSVAPEAKPRLDPREVLNFTGEVVRAVTDPSARISTQAEQISRELGSIWQEIAQRQQAGDIVTLEQVWPRLGRVLADASGLGGKLPEPAASMLNAILGTLPPYSTMALQAAQAGVVVRPGPPLGAPAPAEAPPQTQPPAPPQAAPQPQPPAPQAQAPTPPQAAPQVQPQPQPPSAPQPAPRMMGAPAAPPAEAPPAAPRAPQPPAPPAVEAEQRRQTVLEQIASAFEARNRRVEPVTVYDVRPDTGQFGMRTLLRDQAGRFYELNGAPAQLSARARLVSRAQAWNETHYVDSKGNRYALLENRDDPSLRLDAVSLQPIDRIPEDWRRLPDVRQVRFLTDGQQTLAVGIDRAGGLHIQKLAPTPLYTLGTPLRRRDDLEELALRMLTTLYSTYQATKADIQKSLALLGHRPESSKFLKEILGNVTAEFIRDWNSVLDALNRQLEPGQRIEIPMGSSMAAQPQQEQPTPQAGAPPDELRSLLEQMAAGYEALRKGQVPPTPPQLTIQLPQRKK